METVGGDGLPGEAVHRHAHGQVQHGAEHAAVEGAQAVDLPVLEGEAQGELLGLVVAAVQLRLQPTVEGGGHGVVDEGQLLPEPVLGGEGHIGHVLSLAFRPAAVRRGLKRGIFYALLCYAMLFYAMCTNFGRFCRFRVPIFRDSFFILFLSLVFTGR